MNAVCGVTEWRPCADSVYDLLLPAAAGEVAMETAVQWLVVLSKVWFTHTYTTEQVRKEDVCIITGAFLSM